MASIVSVITNTIRGFFRWWIQLFSSSLLTIQMHAYFCNDVFSFYSFGSPSKIITALLVMSFVLQSSYDGSVIPYPIKENRINHKHGVGKKRR